MVYAKTVHSKSLYSSRVWTVGKQINSTSAGVRENFQVASTVGAGTVAGVVLNHLQIPKTRAAQILDINDCGICI